MAIIWNKVTWYSKLVAVVLFLAVFGWGFYLGASYGIAVGQLQGRADVANVSLSTAPPKLCTFTALMPVTAYQRPSEQAGVFGTVPVGEPQVLGGRTAEGWLGFDPGVAQAPNVGPFRLRWLAPTVPVTMSGDCVHVPVWPTLPPTTCFTMAQADVSIYQTAALTSPMVAQMSFGDYVEVVGRAGTSSSFWVKVRSPLGTLPMGTAGWLPGGDVNFNGTCDKLPMVKS